jgi:hypothetical protein
MNSELPSNESTNQPRSLDERFADKPHVRQRLLEIADMIDELVAQGCTVHEAEARAIEEIRKLGQGILTEKKSPDLALDLWAHYGAGATLACGAARRTGASLLRASPDQQPRVFSAITTGAD